ncbi:MAG: hypothetical protein ACKVVT_00755 [Dehalococcoidia bacterium]
MAGTALLDALAREVLKVADVSESVVPLRGEWPAGHGQVVRVEGHRQERLAQWRLAAPLRPPGPAGSFEVRLATAGEEVEVHVTARTSPAAGTRTHFAQAPAVVEALLAPYSAGQLGDPLGTTPAEYDEATARFLAHYLVDAARTVPTVLITRRNASGKTLLDPGQVAAAVAGLANVSVLADKATSLALSAEVGQLFSCFDGGVRIYWPGCDPVRDDPYRHPIFLPWNIELEGPATLSRVVDRLCRAALEELPASGPLWLATGRRDRPGPAVTALGEARPSAAPEGDMVGALVQRWERLFPSPPAPAVPSPIPSDLTVPPASEAAPLELEEAQVGLPQEAGVAADAQGTGGGAVPEAAGRWPAERDDHLLDLLAEQEQRIGMLEARLNDVMRRLDAAYAPEADDATNRDQRRLRSVEEAVKEARGFGQLHFLPSAMRSARRSTYRYPGRVYDALAAMDAVALARATEASLGQRLQDAFAEYGLKYAPHLSDTAEARFEDDYRFSYQGERVLMEAHLKLGTDFDPANCLRIHFEWDSARQRWVVGYVGSHLRNART